MKAERGQELLVAHLLCPLQPARPSVPLARGPPCCGACHSRPCRWRTAASTAPRWPPTPAAPWSAGRCSPAGSAAPSPTSSHWPHWRGDGQRQLLGVVSITPWHLHLMTGMGNRPPLGPPEGSSNSPLPVSQLSRVGSVCTDCQEGLGSLWYEHVTLPTPFI